MSVTQPSLETVSLEGCFDVFAKYEIMDFMPAIKLRMFME